jgi:hypothetical protein
LGSSRKSATSRISGGHTSVGDATLLSSHAAILGGGGRHGKSRSDPERSTGEKRISPPPSESQTDEPDDNRPPSRQVLTEASCETGAIHETSPALVLARASGVGVAS